MLSLRSRDPCEDVEAIVRSLNQRLQTLEAVADIQIPRGVSERSGRFRDISYRAQIKLGTSQRAGALYSALQRADGMRSEVRDVQIVHLNRPGEGRIKLITILKDITSRNETNGVENAPMIVSHAAVEYFRKSKFSDEPTASHEQSSFVAHTDPFVACKFRLVTRDSQDLTEQEFKNMLVTEQNPRLKDLFPHTLFVGELRGVYDSHTRRQQVWEFVGTELMEEVTDFNQDFYLSAYHVLNALHSRGYCHRDSHQGNFMRIPDRVTEYRDTYNTSRIVMIDQDRIKPLPMKEEWKATLHYLLLQDYIELLTFYNPHFPVYSDKVIKKGKTFEAMNLLYRFMAGRLAKLPEDQRAAHADLARLPWAVTKFLYSSLDEIRQELDHPKAEKYKAFLLSLSVEQIFNYFERLFSSEANMKALNDQWVQELTNDSEGFTYLVQP